MAFTPPPPPTDTNAAWIYDHDDEYPGWMGVCVPIITKLQRVQRATLDPRPGDFLEGAIREARYQAVERDDTWKSDADWFWLVGYLLAKVIHREEPLERRQHHITAAEAALAHWHQQLAGPDTPGLTPGLPSRGIG
jgi:hypothetical protein